MAHPGLDAELKLGLDVRCSRNRVERLMRQAGVAGIHRRRREGARSGISVPSSSDDLVQRAFDPAEPDRLWVPDLTRSIRIPRPARPTWPWSSTPSPGVWWAGRSPITCDPSSWSTPSRWRSGAVVHLLGRPLRILITQIHLHVGAFGRRLRGNGLLGSMGSIGDCFEQPGGQSSPAPSSSSCSTSTTGRAVSSWPRRSSSGSRPGTTRGEDTATARCSVPWTTKPPTRHDQQPTATVRWSGQADPALGVDDLAGAQGPGLRHPSAAQASEELLRAFRGRAPNECWQADMTHVVLEDGSVFEVLNVIDDHSRLCVAAGQWCR